MNKSTTEIELDAEVANLPAVLEFIESRLEALGCPPKTQMHIAVAAEEIFVNIASYAYSPRSGSATVRMEISENPSEVSLTFIDGGAPFDPTEKAPPDMSLPVEDRDVGGLGVYMTKKFMDEVSYEYKDGKNILTLKKMLAP